MVYAECKTAHVTLPVKLNPFKQTSNSNVEIESYQIGSLLSLLDAVLMICILIFLFWLEAKETEEINMSSAGICTGGDYTVFTSYLPHHHDMAQLKRQLAKFLERELSEAPPVFRDGPVEVCDVNFGFNGLNLRIFKKRGLMARKLDLLEEKIFLMNKQYGIVGRCFHKQRMILLDEEVLRVLSYCLLSHVPLLTSIVHCNILLYPCHNSTYHSLSLEGSLSARPVQEYLSRGEEPEGYDRGEVRLHHLL